LRISSLIEGSALKLHQDNRLDLSAIHGDGATTAAKKGGVIQTKIQSNCGVSLPITLDVLNMIIAAVAAKATKE
jgi:hypothetical protein